MPGAIRTLVPVPALGGLASPAGVGRVVALDHLRGFIVALVVLHHAVLAYCRYAHFDRQHYLLSSAPVVDDARWLGFDLLVLLNDSFFMPLMFLLAGLFVWPSLGRKGAAGYLRDRLLRLGLPFAVAVTTVVPLAYLPSFRIAGDEAGFATVWARMVLSGPWPSGPPWFVGVLLVFDVIAVVVFSMSRSHDGAAIRSRPRGQARCFGLLVAVSAIAYLPLLEVYGPARWIAFGPLAVQASRMLLYGIYFAAGIALGRGGWRDAILARDGALRRSWARWAAAAAALSCVLVMVQLARLRGLGTLPPWAGLALYGCAFLLFCGAACFALLGVFLRFAGHHAPVWDCLDTNSYGIYLLHYPVVTWTQYALLGTGLGAVVKAALVFATAMLLSWGATAALRRLPGVARIV
ncbi:MAG TPA: acyltransferase family protein [Rhodopila sp.]|nr:acyltransferase family protein [Rhodopila sp.]